MRIVPALRRDHRMSRMMKRPGHAADGGGGALATHFVALRRSSSSLAACSNRRWGRSRSNPKFRPAQDGRRKTAVNGVVFVQRRTDPAEIGQPGAQVPDDNFRARQRLAKFGDGTRSHPRVVQLDRFDAGRQSAQSGHCRIGQPAVRDDQAKERGAAAKMCQLFFVRPPHRPRNSRMGYWSRAAGSLPPLLPPEPDVTGSWSARRTKPVLKRAYEER